MYSQDFLWKWQVCPKTYFSFHQQDGQFFHQYKYTLLMWGTLAILVQHWSWSAPSLPPLYYSPTNSPASPCISHYITIGTNIWTTFLATHWLLHWLHGPSPYGTIYDPMLVWIPSRQLSSHHLISFWWVMQPFTLRGLVLVLGLYGLTPKSGAVKAMILNKWPTCTQA